MSAKRLGHYVEDIREVLVLHVEHDQSGFTVTPSQVAEKLVHRCSETRCTCPQLALPHEGSAIVLLNADVCLAFTSKRLAHGITMKVPVQLRQYDVAQVFFTVHGIGAGRPLERASLVSNELKDMPVSLVCDPRLWRKTRLRYLGQSRRTSDFHLHWLNGRYARLCGQRYVEQSRDVIMTSNSVATMIDRLLH